MESGVRSNGFISPTRGDAFQGLENEAEDEDEDEVLLNTASLAGEILENFAKEEGGAGDDTTVEDGLEEEEEGEEEEGEEEEEVEEGGEAEESSINRARTPRSAKRRKVMPEAPPEEGEAEFEEERELAEEEDDDPANSTPNPTPNPRTKSRNPLPLPSPKLPISKPTKPAPPPGRRETIEITVHRLSKPKFKSKSHPQPKQKALSINPLDVLSQIFKEILKKQYKKLDSPAAKLALEVFADEIEVRLLEHTDTLNTTLQAAKELRRYQKVKQEKREELMALRMELGKVEGEIDEVRRRFEKDSRESNVCLVPHHRKYLRLLIAVRVIANTSHPAEQTLHLPAP